MMSEAVLETLLSMFWTAYKSIPNDWLHRPDFLVEYFSRRGKALRPALLLSSFLMVKARQESKTILDPGYIREVVKSHYGLLELAACLERLHIALMALDDVFDGGAQRRGGPSLHLLHEQHAALKEWEYHNTREYWIHPPSSRAYVADCATLTVMDLWMALLRSNGTRPLRIRDFNLLTNKLLIADSRGSRKPYDTGKPDRSIEFTHDEILSQIQRVLNELGCDLRHRGLYGNRYNLMGLLLNGLQYTLDGERIDLDWAGTCATKAELTLWRRWNPRLAPRRHPKPEMPTLGDLLDNQELKTTHYSIKFPILSGAMLANSDLPYNIQAALSAFALNYGEAFQIADDLLVMRPESETGKSSLGDLSAHSKTSVTVVTYWRLPENRRRAWLDLLTKCRTSESARQRALKLIQRTGTPEYCHQMVRELVANCDEALEILTRHGYETGPLQYIATRAIGWMDDARVTEVEE